MFLDTLYRNPHFKRGYNRGKKLAEPIIHHPVFRRALLTVAILVVVYTAAISITSIFIYQHHARNWWTNTTEHLFPYPVAVVNGQSIALSRFRLEVAAREHYASVHNIPTNRAETEQFVMDKLVNNLLFEKALADNSIIVQESDVNAKLDEIYQEIGGQDKLSKFLRENYGDNIDLAQFRLWIRESLVEAAVQTQLLSHVTLRHILVALPDNPTDQQVADAKQKASDIEAKITDVSQFSAIAAQYSEDIGSRDKGGQLGTSSRGFVADQFSQQFEDTAFSLPINQVSDPVRSKYGWHLILVDQRQGKIDLNTDQYIQQLKKAAGVRVFYKI